MDTGRRELEFVGELGRGGFGAVYLANLRGSDRFVRRVAVKVLKPGLLVDPQVIARQRDEARLLGLLSHHAVVQVLDLVTVQGRPAVLMEYVEGLDAARIAAQLRQDGQRLSERAVLEIVRAAASALHAVYNAPAPDTGAPLRVIHRDIKPANLLITAHGGVKVLDFGVARADFQREGVTGSTFFGTAAYMAPEFWLGDTIGPAYDVYALGVTMLELLSGRAPERAILEGARYDEWLEARLATVDVGEEAAALLREMLAFRASDRPDARDVEERADHAAGRANSESLPRLARRLIPPLLEARLAAMAVDELPSHSQLVPSGSDGTPSAAGETMAQGDWLPPAQTTLALPTTPRRRPWAWFGALAGAGALTLVCAGLAWGTWGQFPTGAPGGDPLEAPDVGTTTAGPPAGGASSEAGGVGTSPGGSTASGNAADAANAPDAAGAPPAALPVAPATAAEAAPGGASPTAATVSTASSAPSTGGTTTRRGAGGSSGSASDTPVRIAAASPATSTPAGSTPAASPAPATTSAAPPEDRATTAPPSAAEDPAATAAVVEPPTVHPVRFSSVPMGGAVVLNGSQRCTTPCKVSLPEGSYTLQILLGDSKVQRTISVGPSAPNSFKFDAATGDWKASRVVE